MTRRIPVLTILLVGGCFTSVAGAQDDPGAGGVNSFPRSNAENQAAAAALATRAPVVRITRSTPLGAVVARGRRAAAVPFGGPGGGAAGPCEYNAAFQIEILEGLREVVYVPNEADCTLVLESIQDTNVVEPGDVPLVQRDRGARGLFASLWRALFPTVSAQTLWVERSAYHHIYSCGAACAGGIDGLTAQQSFLYYSQTTSYPRQVRLSNQTFEWFCTAGQRLLSVGWRSNCQPILETPGAPNVPREYRLARV